MGMKIGVKLESLKETHIAQKSAIKTCDTLVVSKCSHHFINTTSLLEVLKKITDFCIQPRAVWNLLIDDKFHVSKETATLEQWNMKIWFYQTSW